jgi:hypothetical protein
MSFVEVLGVEVINNPAKFTDQLGFKITFKCNVKTQEGKGFSSVSGNTFVSLPAFS